MVMGAMGAMVALVTLAEVENKEGEEESAGQQKRDDATTGSEGNTSSV